MWLRLRLWPRRVGVHGVRVVRGMVLRGLLRRRVLLRHTRMLVVGEGTLWHAEGVAAAIGGASVLLHGQLLRRGGRESSGAPGGTH